MTEGINVLFIIIGGIAGVGLGIFLTILSQVLFQDFGGAEKRIRGDIDRAFKPLEHSLIELIEKQRLLENYLKIDLHSENIKEFRANHKTWRDDLYIVGNKFENKPNRKKRKK